jgi:hypothetical protein
VAAGREDHHGVAALEHRQRGHHGLVVALPASHRERADRRQPPAQRRTEQLGHRHEREAAAHEQGEEELVVPGTVVGGVDDRPSRRLVRAGLDAHPVGQPDREQEGDAHHPLCEPRRPVTQALVVRRQRGCGVTHADPRR